MGKLYGKYADLKKKNQDCIYLFKSGIFYIALEKDAEIISEKVGLKLTNFDGQIQKCGFPTCKLEDYTARFNAQKIKFQIIDDSYGKIDNYEDYLNNSSLKEITNKIIDLDFNNMTYKQAFEMLYKMNEELKTIYNK